MIRAIGLSSLLACTHVAASAGAQQMRFFYPEPSPEAVRITRGVRFATADTLHLAMDVYRPANTRGSSPALIFYIPSWTAEGKSAREASDWIKSWARVAAANGLVGIIPDLRAKPGTGNSRVPTSALGDDFQRLVAYIGDHASEYGIDPERLAVFSASGAAWAALPAVQDPHMTAVKAAVIYYGSADITKFRVDLPMLFVRAGLDSRSMNASIAKVTDLAVSQNAPVTVLNYHTGHHGFESRDDNAATRQIIDETIDFVKRATEPSFQAVIRSAHLDAVAAGQMNEGKYREAALTYAELVKQRPADGQTRFTYAQVLLADKQYDAACRMLRQLKPVSFEAILPGARSCLLAGAVDTAIVWLQGIRKDWLRSEYVSGLRTDSVFAPLWARPEFQALFRP